MRSFAAFMVLIVYVFATFHTVAQVDTINIAVEPVVTSDGRITLHVENTEISSVLRFFSEVGRVNIVAGPEVSGRISANLEQVPLAEALDAILGIAGFTYYRVGSIVFVTTEEKKALLPATAQDLEVRTFRVNHVELSEIIVMLEEMLAPSGRVWPSPANTLVVRASAHYLAVVERILKELDVPPRQVRIAVKIINVRRDDNLSIGVGFDTFAFTQFGIEAISSGFAQPFPFGSEGSEASGTGMSSGIFMGTLQSDSRAFLEALDETSDVEILASPEILVLDGEKARIQVGDRLGFRITTTTQTSSLESVEFLEVGTVLDVTPRIADDGLVRLEINPKVSNGSIDATGLPTESTTEISTTMLVANDETVIIGGLLNATRQRVKSQIPFLGNIPIIGRLFGKSRWIDNKSEVVVLITPHIVGSITPSEMQKRIDAATRRWGELGQKGLVRDEITFPKDSPTRRWGNRFKSRKSHNRGEKSNQTAPVHQEEKGSEE